MNMDIATQTDAVEYQCLRCGNNSQSHPKSKQRLSKHKKNHETLHSSKLPKSRSSSTSSLNSDSDLGTGKLNNPTPNSIVQKQTYRPPILDDTSCPTTYHTFWKLKAQTRRLPPNQTKISKYVAPRFSLTMLQLAEQCNIPDLLSKEFTVFAQAYDEIVQVENYLLVDTTTPYKVGVSNSKQDLILTGNYRILDSITRNTPPFPNKNLKTLSALSVTQFFAQVRTYMLKSSIPWNEFSAYFLTSAFLGQELYTKVISELHSYPNLLQTSSCVIEKIIIELIPIQTASSQTVLISPIPHRPKNRQQQHSSSALHSLTARTNTSLPQLQDRCDNCLKLGLAPVFCHSHNHCRRDGHQPDFRNSPELERRVQHNEPDTFITHNNCPKCFPCSLKTTQQSTQWLHGNKSSQVLTPPNYFNKPFRPPPNYIHHTTNSMEGMLPMPAAWQLSPPRQRPQYQEYTPQNNQPTTNSTHNYRHQSANQGEYKYRSPYSRQGLQQ